MTTTRSAKTVTGKDERNPVTVEGALAVLRLASAPGSDYDTALAASVDEETSLAVAYDREASASLPVAKAVLAAKKAGATGEQVGTALRLGSPRQNGSRYVTAAALVVQSNRKGQRPLSLRQAVYAVSRGAKTLADAQKATDGRAVAEKDRKTRKAQPGTGSQVEKRAASLASALAKATGLTPAEVSALKSLVTKVNTLVKAQAAADKAALKVAA